MSDVADPVATLQMRLAIYRRTIDFLEEQRARFGPFTPPHVRHQLEETRQEIARLKQELHAAGAVVDDRSGDTDPAQSTIAVPFPSIDSGAVLLAYQRMLVDRLRYLSIAGLSDWGDPGLQMTDLYVERPLTALGSGAANTTLVDIMSVPRARILVEGALGSGKSTSLRWLALACAAQGAGEPAQASAALSGWSAPAPLPILITANELLEVAAASEAAGEAAGNQRSPALSIVWAAIERLLQHNDLGLLIPLIQQSLNAGNCLVLLDGLDDLAAAEGGRSIGLAVGRFIARYPDNRYVITCRHRSAAPLLALPGFAQYAFSPLDETQADILIARWYAAIAHSLGVLAQDEVPERIAVLQGQIQADERLRDIAATPLGLVLCVLIHAEGQSLLTARGKLYARLIDLLLERWDHLRTDGAAPMLAQALGIPALATPGQRLKLLQPLAFAAQSRSDVRNPQPAAMSHLEVEPLLRAPLIELGVETWRAVEQLVPQLLAWCCRQGILAQVDQAYTMPVRPLREYLAGCALAGMPDFPRRAHALAGDPGWHETILLAAHELSRGPASHSARELLRLLIESPPSGNTANALLLAAACLLELGEWAGPERTLAAEVQRQLVVLLTTLHCPVAERVRAGLLLGRLGDTRFGGLLPPLAQVAGGYFVLGTHEGYDDEGPVQQVYVPTFAIGKYPVTNAEYACFLNDEIDYPRPRYWYDPRFNNPSQPVVGVTWDDAVAYCGWLTRRLNQAGLLPPGTVVRLPTEFEWEKAASWDPQRQVKRRFPWGDEWIATRANTAEGRGVWVTAPVGCYPDGVSAYGVHDMIGNVWEWTASTYASYHGAALPFHEEGSYTLRGSSCVSLPIHVRCTYRSRLPASYWRYHLGFRIVIARP